MIKSFIKKIFQRANFHLINNRNNGFSISISDFFNLFFIYDSGHELIRIGHAHDSGYLLPNILNQIDFNISPGVGDRHDFEEQLMKHSIKSFLIDGTVDYRGPFPFLKKNINTYDDEKNITLDTFISGNTCLKESSNLMMQMDIEGDELMSILRISEKKLLQFKILIIEFHSLDSLYNLSFLKIYHSVFVKILKHFDIVHMHPNNWGNAVPYNDIKISSIVEFTFLRKDLMIAKKNIKYSLPHILDQKNCEYRADIKLPETFYKRKL